MRRAVSCDSAPFMRMVRCLTVANTLSIGFEVRKWSQAWHRPYRRGQTRQHVRAGHEGIERTVLVVRRAEITQPGMRLAFDVRGKCRRQPRLADSWLAGNQHHPSFAGFCLLPTPPQQLDFFVAPDERRLPRAQGLEPAQFAAFAQHSPGPLGLGKAGKLLQHGSPTAKLGWLKSANGANEANVFCRLSTPGPDGLRPP